MKRNVFLSVLVIAMVFAVTGCGKKQESTAKQNDAMIIFSIGDVQVRNGDNWTPAAEQMRVVQGNEIKTGPQSECNIQIGTDSFVTVKEKSHMVLSTLLRDVAGLEDSTLELRMGKSVVNPRKLLKGDSFKVKTPTAIAAVRGTRFVVQSDPQGEMRVAVVDGRVEVKRRVPALETLEENVIQKSVVLTDLRQRVDQESIVVDANQSATMDNVQAQSENQVIEQAVERHRETLAAAQGAEAPAVIPPAVEGEKPAEQQQAAQTPRPPELVEVDRSLSGTLSGLQIMQEKKKKEEPVQIRVAEKVESQDVQDVQQLDTVIQDQKVKESRREVTTRPVTRLSIVSPIKGSSIFVNGKLAAYDSAILTPDPDRELKIIVRAKGYAPFETTVVLKEGEQKEIQVTFRENGKLTIISPIAGGDIYIDGRKVGKGRVSVEQIPGIEFEVRISVRDFKDHNERLTLQPGESREIAPQMERSKAMERIRWSRKIGSEINAMPIHVNNLVVITTADGYVTVVNQDGQNLWRVNLKRRIESSPVVSGGRVYVVTSSGDFVALSLASGETLWKQKMFGALLFGSSPVVTADRIFCASSYGRIYAFSMEGKEIWTRDIENGIYTTPAYSNGCLYFGAEDYNMYCLSTEKGRVEWKFKADGRMVSSSPVIDGNRVYFGCYSGSFYSIDAGSGREVWRFKTGDAILTSPLIRDGAVYIGSNDGYLYSLESSNGTVRWKFQVGARMSGAPAYDNGLVYMAGGKRIYALNPSNGGVQWSQDFAGKVRTSASVSGNDIYVGLDNGEVASLRNSLFTVYQ